MIYQWYVLFPKRSSGCTQLDACVCIKHTVYVWNGEIKSRSSFHEERQWGWERVNWEPGVWKGIKWGREGLKKAHFRVLFKVGFFPRYGLYFLHLNLTKRKLEKVHTFFCYFAQEITTSWGIETENIIYTNNVKKHNEGIFFSSALSGLKNLEEHWIKSQGPQFLVLLCPQLLVWPWGTNLVLLDLYFLNKMISKA